MDDTVWPKLTTIRAGKKVKAGDFIVFYVWAGKPYRSKWMRIFEPIEVKKVYDFKYLNGLFYLNNKVIEDFNLVPLIATNDGLSIFEFLAWFKEPFDGQIICWNENVNYNDSF